MTQAAGAAIAATLCTTAASAGDRFPELKPEQMTPDQKKVVEEILSGPRKSLQGPFNAWLRSPELADRLQKVGEYVRFSTSLDHRLNEFAILIVSREWTAQLEWEIHSKLAVDAGLDPKIVADVAAGKRPSGMRDDEKIIYDFCTELYQKKTVGNPTYQAALKAFGERGVTDLVAVNGYYVLVSMTLNVAEVPTPSGKLPLAPIANR